MTVHTPPRTARSVMASASTFTGDKVILLDNASYPGFSDLINQTHSFSGTDWTQIGTTLIDASGPLPCRIDASMAYDGTSLVLFGGKDASGVAGYLNDTWLYNSGWTKQTPATSPTQRAKAEMAYLASNTTSVLFGGINQISMLNETWTWSHSTLTWSLKTLATSPAARYDFGMAASPTQVILFGGKGGNLEFNDTWSWNGTVWAQLSPATSPSCRSEFCMTYDTANSNWVLFGGRDGLGVKNDTWTFDGTTWTLKAPTLIPAGRTSAQMCYDPQLGKVIMFGGQGNNEVFNHIFAWSGSQWTTL